MFRRARPAPPPPAPAAPTRKLTGGKLAYESRRAAEAGMKLEEWLARKAREAARAASEKAAPKAAPRKKGFFARLLDKAHRPI